jgi:hypothetical protein
VALSVCGLSLLAVPSTVQAQGDARVEPSPGRREVVLRLEPGELDPGQTEALLNLLRTELSELALRLSVEQTTESETRWFAGPHDQTALLLASVDVSATEGWRVFLVDPDDGRVSVRELGPGGEDNAAMIEAVASVLVSAASALAQGDEAATESPPPTASKPPTPAPAKHPRPAAPSPGPVEVTPLELPRRFRWHLALGLGASSFARSEPVMVGPELAVGVLQSKLFAIDVCATRYVDANFQTSQGDFSLTRSALSLRGGPSFDRGALAFVPQLVALAELVQRERGLGSAGQIAEPSSDSTRFALGAATLVRYSASDLLLLEASLAGTFFPQPLRLTANGGEELLVAPWSFVAGAFVGLGVRL